MSGIATLAERDYQVIGLDYHSLVKLVEQLPDRSKWWIENVTHILAFVGWLQCVLDAERMDSQKVIWQRNIRVREKLPDEAFDQALWTQFYLLLTCADALGYLDVCGVRKEVEKRFGAFWIAVGETVRSQLQDSLLACCTSDVEFPTVAVVRKQVQSMIPAERWNHLCRFLYGVRNGLVHEGNPPDCGWHPVLAHLQAVRLGVSGVKELSSMVHLDTDPGRDMTHHYFCVIETPDPIATLHAAILRGLRNILDQSRGVAAG
jgi:hypothetical protein